MNDLIANPVFKGSEVSEVQNYQSITFEWFHRWRRKNVPDLTNLIPRCQEFCMKLQDVNQEKCVKYLISYQGHYYYRKPIRKGFFFVYVAWSDFSFK